MERKLIFLDIDGTLTVAGSNVPPASAVDAIKKAQGSGHEVFLCTGRNMEMLRPLLKYGFDGVVASAGGYVLYKDKVIYDCPMTDGQTKTALDVLKKNNVFRTIEALDGTYGDSEIADLLDGGAEGNSEIERWRKALAENLGIQPMEKYDGRPIYKVVIMCLNESQLDEPKQLLEKDFEFCMQVVTEHAGCINGDLINRKFDKGKGVLKVCEAAGVSVEDTIGFGDSMNDLAMIQTVGFSVCMANGAEELKKLSNAVCPAVEEDGLAKQFEAMGLI